MRQLRRIVVGSPHVARTYLDDDFLLLSETARTLYHGTAAHQWIIDYHTHLPPEEIANDHRWENITDLWLGHDHYKWRAMRSCSGRGS